MKPSDFFTPAQKTAMVAAIRQAEKDTSGEIRIHFENHCRKNVLDRAAQVFADLKMHKTALRNGVLIYVALEDKQLAILGDAGINAKVPDHFWDDIKNNMIEKFKSGQICEGVCEAVLTAGQEHFHLRLPRPEENLHKAGQSRHFQIPLCDKYKGRKPGTGPGSW